MASPAKGIPDLSRGPKEHDHGLVQANQRNDREKDPENRSSGEELGGGNKKDQWSGKGGQKENQKQSQTQGQLGEELHVRAQLLPPAAFPLVGDLGVHDLEGHEDQPPREQGETGGHVEHGQFLEGDESGKKGLVQLLDRHQEDSRGRGPLPETLDLGEHGGVLGIGIRRLEGAKELEQVGHPGQGPEHSGAQGNGEHQGKL